MAPLPVGQGSKEPARGGVLGVSSATSGTLIFSCEFPLLLVPFTVAPEEHQKNPGGRDRIFIGTRSNCVIATLLLRRWT